MLDRLDQILDLIRGGAYGPASEKSLLAWVRGSRGPRGRAVVWLRIFSALMCARRYHEAFRLGEEILARDCLSNPNYFLWPWREKVPSRYSEQRFRFCKEELASLRDSARSGEFPHWFALCRGILLGDLNRRQEALREHDLIAALRPARYVWMRHPFVMFPLLAEDYEGTIAICRPALKLMPGAWWIRCRMAEALLLKGDAPGALREFKRAAAGAEAETRNNVLTWHGEALLWLGRYREARDMLDEAVRGGAGLFVFGWRGAARLKLGDFEGALSDLDKAISLDATDLEAFVWRGEAHLRMGRPDEAMADLDRAVAIDGNCWWGYVDRGLTRQALGDEKGLAADYSRVPADVVSSVRADLGLPEGRLTADAMAKVLEECLKRAKGVRRWEGYLRPLWLGRGVVCR